MTISIRAVFLALQFTVLAGLVSTAVHSCVVSQDAGKNAEWADFDRRQDSQKDYRDRVRKK